MLLTTLILCLGVGLHSATGYGYKPTGCVVKGRHFSEGQTVPDGDPCRDCICRGGRVACSAVRCPRTPCSRPVHVPGKCCPVCPLPAVCVVNGRVYKEGQSIPDKDPCRTCVCREGRVVCAVIDCARPPCSRPVHLPGKCCPICPKPDPVCPPLSCPKNCVVPGWPCPKCVCAFPTKKLY